MARGDSGDLLCQNTKLNSLRTLRLFCSSTLTVASDITLCVRSGYPLSPVHAPKSPISLSLLHILQWFLSGLSTELLQSDTGVPHFALDPLTHRCLLSLSPAEPRPPRNIPPPPDSGWEALRPAAPPPPPPPPFLERKLATVICFPGL